MTKIESNFASVINASIPANVSALLQANIARARTNYDGVVAKLQSYADVSNTIIPIEATARAVGCETVTGLSRAFRAEFGVDSQNCRDFSRRSDGGGEGVEIAVDLRFL